MTIFIRVYLIAVKKTRDYFKVWLKMHKNIERYLTKQIEIDLKQKMVLLAGPRQVGKTTLAKQLLKKRDLNENDRYINWDVTRDREKIIQEKFPFGKGLIVLDEIHKYSRWRQIVKGLYDKRGDELEILVTGSAKLEYYRYGGDSLQGRYHFHRIHPLSLAELGSN